MGTPPGSDYGSPTTALLAVAALATDAPGFRRLVELWTSGITAFTGYNVSASAGGNHRLMGRTGD